MSSPASIERNGVLIISDNYSHPLFRAALVALGFIVIGFNVSSTGGLLIGIGLTAVAMLGFIRSTVTLDRRNQTVTVRRALLGIGKARCYGFRGAKGVDTRWTKFGEMLLMSVADGRNVKRLRMAGPSRTDLTHLRDEVRRYLAGA